MLHSWYEFPFLKCSLRFWSNISIFVLLVYGTFFQNINYLYFFICSQVIFCKMQYGYLVVFCTQSVYRTPPPPPQKCNFLIVRLTHWFSLKSALSPNFWHPLHFWWDTPKKKSRLTLGSYLCVWCAVFACVTAAHLSEWAAMPAFPTEKLACTFLFFKYGPTGKSHGHFDHVIFSCTCKHAVFLQAWCDRSHLRWGACGT